MIIDLLIKTSTLNPDFLAIILIKQNKLGKIPDKIQKSRNWSLLFTIPPRSIPIINANATYTSNHPKPKTVPLQSYTNTHT
jgi:hypothetical protein